MHLMSNGSSSLLSSMVGTTLASSLPSYEKESKLRIRSVGPASPLVPAKNSF
jgi:hypothetical protein